jgi:hypothetical protein
MGLLPFGSRPSNRRPVRLISSELFHATRTSIGIVTAVVGSLLCCDSAVYDRRCELRLPPTTGPQG